VSLHRFLLLASSLLVPLLAMLAFYAAGWALGLRYDLVTYFAIVPPAIVLTVVPISIAGWGVREGVLVGLFSLIGADKTVVLMMSLVYGTLLILVSLPGLVVFLRGRRLWIDRT
jgi:glycosyltransferase 2 family protein